MQDSEAIRFADAFPHAAADMGVIPESPEEDDDGDGDEDDDGDGDGDYEDEDEDE